MKKQSVFVTIAVGFVAFYVMYSIGFFTYFVVENYSQHTERTVLDTSNYLKMSRILLRDAAKGEADLEDLIDRLNDGLTSKRIHFYYIRENGEDIVYGNAHKDGTEDKVPVLNDPLEGQYTLEEYRYSVINEGPFTVIVGHKTSLKAFFQDMWVSQRDFIIKDIMLVVLGAIFLVLYTFRDLRALIAALSKKGASRGRIDVAKSKETLSLVRGFKGYESKVENLTRQNQLFRSQVLPALRKELESGKPPPYEFGCTLGRTDINNFTSIFTSDKRPHFMETIDEFFIGVTHIVSRYGGYVYEFVGDEVLFYFKDEEHDNSAAIALSALRDINEFAMEISERTESEANYQFRVKSSLAHGLLHFGPLVDAFALAGPPLIETVRMLNYVHEKSENVVLYDESVQQMTSFLVRSKTDQVVMLKGLQGARRLHRYETHTPLSLHLRQADEKAFESTTYYRSDEAIVEILGFVNGALGTVPSSKLNKLLTSFKKYRVTQSSKQVRTSYLEVVEALLLLPRSEENDFLLASAVSASIHLFTEADWNGPLRKMMLKCVESENRRVVANALDVFAEFDANAGEEVFKKLIALSDNRIAANALVKEGKKEWNKKIARKLEAMLKAKSAYFKASGLFALGEIAYHLKKADEVVYSAEPRMQKLLADVPKFALHANAMVRRQCYKVIEKTELWSALEETLETAHGLPIEVRVEIQEVIARSKPKSQDSTSDGKRAAS